MRVHIQESGDWNEIPIVMVHGAGGSSATWYFQMKGLSSQFHTVAVDLNGHGKSNDLAESPVMDSYIEDVLSVLEELKDSFLMGHSMGGAITQRIALEHAHLVKGIILVGTGAKLRVNPMIFDMLTNDFDAYVNAVAEFMFDQSTATEIREASQAEVQKCPPEIIERDFRACDSFDIMESVREIKVPTLIIVGENDIMTPVKYSRYLHEQIQGSQLEIIPNAGHAVMLEQPEKFNEAVQDWVLSLGDL